MGFFDFLQEPVKVEERDMDSNISKINSLFNNDTETITLEKVEAIPAVQTCTNIICGTIASLPIYLYRELENGDIEKINNDRRVFLLNDEPNPIINGFNFKKQLVKDYLFYGTGYGKIDWKNNEVQELWLLEADKVSTKKYYMDGYKLQAELTYNGQDGAVELDVDEMLMILKDSADGLTSKGLLETGKGTFNIALSENEYTKNVFSRGALPIGILKTSGRLSKEAIIKLRNSWQNLYSGVKNSASTVVLEEGLDYTPVSLNPNDLDLTNSKKNSISEICRLFGIPESLVNAQSNKYGSVSQNNLHFLQYCLSPILTSIENSLNKSLLLEDEKAEGYFFAFDTSEVLRTTEKEKYEAIQIALSSGIMSINEARQRINMNKISKNFFRWTIGNVLYDPDRDEMIIPNMGIGIDTTNTNNHLQNKKEDTKENEEVNEDDR